MQICYMQLFIAIVAYDEFKMGDIEVNKKKEKKSSGEMHAYLDCLNGIKKTMIGHVLQQEGNNHVLVGGFKSVI